MGKYNIFYLFENPRRGMQARNFTTNVPKILDLKSSSEQIFPRKLSLGAPDSGSGNHALPYRSNASTQVASDAFLLISIIYSFDFFYNLKIVNADRLHSF